MLGMPEFSPDIRVAGVLIPVFAIRTDHDLGIGDTQGVVEFAQWAASHGLRALQILPVNETGADHSPYNILSSMAIEPSTVATHPSAIPDLRQADFEEIAARHDLAKLREGRVDYDGVKALKLELLRAAYDRFCETRSRTRPEEYAEFRHQERAWIEDYATFRALVEWNGTEVTSEWPDAHQSPDTTRAWREALPPDERESFESEVDFRVYIQWIAFTQWEAAREACHESGVALVGDIPVGVSIYSADVWAEPGIFDLTRSSGAPPERIFAADPFTAKWGQNWGFPLYDWFAMSRDNFTWWRRRLRTMKRMFDLIRVDHALGFFRIYSFPWRPERNAEFLELSDDEAAARTGGRLPGFVPNDDNSDENREKNRRHGEMIFRVFLEETGPNCLIAEDLGEVAPYVRPVLAELGIPGFKIPQWEREPGAPITPGDTYARLSLATYATHDHPPVRSFWNTWFTEVESGDAPHAEHALGEMRQLLEFSGDASLELPRRFDPQIHEITLRGLFRTNSWLAIPMITDILGEEERYNVPGATGNQNWSLRLSVPVSKLDATFAEALACLGRALADSPRRADL